MWMCDHVHVFYCTSDLDRSFQTVINEIKFVVMK